MAEKRGMNVDCRQNRCGLPTFRPQPFFLTVPSICRYLFAANCSSVTVSGSSVADYRISDVDGTYVEACSVFEAPDGLSMYRYIDEYGVVYWFIATYSYVVFRVSEP